MLKKLQPLQNLLYRAWNSINKKKIVTHDEILLEIVRKVINKRGFSFNDEYNHLDIHLKNNRFYPRTSIYKAAFADLTIKHKGFDYYVPNVDITLHIFKIANLRAYQQMLEQGKEQNLLTTREVNISTAWALGALATGVGIRYFLPYLLNKEKLKDFLTAKSPKILSALTAISNRKIFYFTLLNIGTLACAGLYTAYGKEYKLDQRLIDQCHEAVEGDVIRRINLEEESADRITKRVTITNTIQNGNSPFHLKLEDGKWKQYPGPATFEVQRKESVPINNSPEDQKIFFAAVRKYLKSIIGDKSSPIEK